MQIAVCALAGWAIGAAAALAEVSLPEPPVHEAIAISADAGCRWTEGVYDVWLLAGHCRIEQGTTSATAQEAVLWIERGGPLGDPPHKIIAYLDGAVAIDYLVAPTGASPSASGAAKTRLTDSTWLGRWYSARAPNLRVPRMLPKPAALPPVYSRATAARDAEARSPVRLAQFAHPVAPPGGFTAPRGAIESLPAGPAAPAATLPPVGARRVRLFSRSDVRPSLQAETSPDGSEWIAVLTGGVNIVVDGLAGFGSLDIKSDRLVVWTPAGGELDLGGATFQDEHAPLEFYMEGNIEFRQGDRTIYAQRMYYDVRRRVGVVLGAELLTPVPNYEGLLRLRAEVVQQVGENEFVASNAGLTSSRLGEPTYEFRSGTITYRDQQRPAVDPLTGQPAVDPTSGEPIVQHDQLATSQNNVLWFSGVPVFYWPTLATDLQKPTYYVDSFKFKHDKIFGTQVLVDLDAYQVLGIKDPPKNTKWDFSLDYLSDRGFAAGTSLSYDRFGLFDIPGRYYGLVDAWGLHDDGLDNLGRDRDSLVPEQDWRGRVLARHRQYLPNNFLLTAEVGLISDRNFLEQYFEHEWDEFKDQATGIELKQIVDNTSWSISGDVRVNAFFTETTWGRLDHFWLGQPLVDDRLTWFEHSDAAYALMKTASEPLNPQDKAVFELLPWEVKAQGERLVTRQEIDLPFSAGPFKIVPYALGELAHWGEALDGEPLERAYGQVGLRATLPFWAVDPSVEDSLFNVHGLAHKVELVADISYADANRNLDELPLYEPLDDNNIESFRRQFKFTTFGLPFGTDIPPQFDERFFALRYGLQDWVTAPATEIADDLVAARLGLHQRWQTKRGPEQNRRIVEWIVFDTDLVLFPDPGRDNFGESVGLIDYNFRWHVGDRLTLVSDGFFDVFADGAKYVTVGGFLSRPPRGSAYLGVRSLEGPMSSTVLLASYAYQMSPKWVSTMGAAVGLNKSGNIGEHLAVTRIGESFLVTLGINIDASKGNVGANFAIEPRFLPKSRLGTANGLQIPPAGAYGLE